MTNVPDLIQPVIGYRCWTLLPDPRKLEFRLRSAGVGEAFWEEGTNTAECKYTAEHDAPERECGCGLYAQYDLRPILEYGGVAGAVVAWGRIEAHHDGFRAQYAKPVVVSYPEKLLSKDRPPFERLVRRYGAIACERSELAEKAREFGIEVPEEFRPSEQELVEALLRLGAGSPVQHAAGSHHAVASGMAGPSSMHGGGASGALMPSRQAARLALRFWGARAQQDDAERVETYRSNRRWGLFDVVLGLWNLLAFAAYSGPFVRWFNLAAAAICLWFAGWQFRQLGIKVRELVRCWREFRHASHKTKYMLMNGLKNDNDPFFCENCGKLLKPY